MIVKKDPEKLRPEIEARLKAGESRASISRDLGTNPKTLTRWIQKWAEESPESAKELSPAEIRAAREMLSQGMGVRQVAQQLWRDRKRHHAA